MIVLAAPPHGRNQRTTSCPADGERPVRGSRVTAASAWCGSVGREVGIEGRHRQARPACGPEIMPTASMHRRRLQEGTASERQAKPVSWADATIRGYAHPGPDLTSMPGPPMIHREFAMKNDRSGYALSTDSDGGHDRLSTASRLPFLWRSARGL